MRALKIIGRISMGTLKTIGVICLLLWMAYISLDLEWSRKRVVGSCINAWTEMEKAMKENDSVLYPEYRFRHQDPYWCGIPEMYNWSRPR